MEKTIEQYKKNTVARLAKGLVRDAHRIHGVVDPKDLHTGLESLKGIVGEGLTAEIAREARETLGKMHPRKRDEFGDITNCPNTLEEYLQVFEPYVALEGEERTDTRDLEIIGRMYAVGGNVCTTEDGFDLGKLTRSYVK